jgi:HEPN domain-containing protein
MVPETNWKNYLIKADQFLETARDAFENNNWNAVGLNAVHSAISANDAISVYYKKKRSISDKHSDAVGLLLEVMANSGEAKLYSKHLSWLISRKNLIEYESRLFFEKEAHESLKHAERFVFWAKKHLSV